MQPKKETVRINLPPKPTAVPTIKIPAPAASAGAAKPAAPAAAAPVATAPATAAATAAAPAAATPRPAAAQVGRPAAAPRAAAAPAVSGLDLGLAITAAVVCVLAFARVVLLK